MAAAQVTRGAHSQTQTSTSSRLTVKDCGLTKPWRLSVKVGDLVKNRKSDWSGIVLKVNHHRAIVPHILIFDKEGSVFWERMNDYEVISESR